MAAAGVVLAWLLFYYLGLTLTRIPSEFHAEPEAGRRNRLPHQTKSNICRAVGQAVSPVEGVTQT
jgi:hypothetical protein